MNDFNILAYDSEGNVIKCDIRDCDENAIQVLSGTKGYVNRCNDHYLGLKPIEFIYRHLTKGKDHV